MMVFIIHRRGVTVRTRNLIFCVQSFSIKQDCILSSDKKSNLNSFEQIKVLYWYSEVKAALVDYLAEDVIKSSSETRRKIVRIIEQIKNPDLESSSTNFSDNIEDLKSLIDEINGLGKNNHKERWGPLDSHLANHLQQIAMGNGLKDLLPDAGGNPRLPSEKTWSRYRLAKNKPENYINAVDTILKCPVLK